MFPFRIESSYYKHLLIRIQHKYSNSLHTFGTIATRWEMECQNNVSTFGYTSCVWKHRAQTQQQRSFHIWLFFSLFLITFSTSWSVVCACACACVCKCMYVLNWLGAERLEFVSLVFYWESSQLQCDHALKRLNKFYFIPFECIRQHNIDYNTTKAENRYTFALSVRVNLLHILLIYSIFLRYIGFLSS